MSNKASVLHGLQEKYWVFSSIHVGILIHENNESTPAEHCLKTNVWTLYVSLKQIIKRAQEDKMTAIFSLSKQTNISSTLSDERPRWKSHKCSFFQWAHIILSMIFENGIDTQGHISVVQLVNFLLKSSSTYSLISSFIFFSNFCSFAR